MDMSFWRLINRALGLVPNCPICGRGLDQKHLIAYLGATDFAQWEKPTETAFFKQLESREWAEVTRPFTFLTIVPQDTIGCDLTKCPEGLGLIVWTSLDMLTNYETRVVHGERLDEAELDRIAAHISLDWKPCE